MKLCQPSCARRYHPLTFSLIFRDPQGRNRVVWRRGQRTPYVPSPPLYGHSLYFLRHYQGILLRVDAKSGEEPSGPLQLDGIRNMYASPVGATNRVYIVDLNGTTLVLSHGAAPKTLARNRLDDSFSTSPAVVDRELILRGEQYPYCIAEE